MNTHATANSTVANSVIDLIGNTPIVALNRLAPAGSYLYAKLESRNPGGSVKDRMARSIIEAAERDGSLKPGQTVVEATSGNTGIALAMICAAKGYPFIAVMAESFSLERRRLLRLLGAKVVLTPAGLKGSGMVAKARELAEHLGAFYCDQFNNPANPEAHRRTTALEILRSFEGKPLDAIVLGAGTGGSVSGIAEVIKRERPNCRIVLCEPSTARLLGSGLDQPTEAGDGRTATHPAFRPHPIQGWTPDFVSSPLQAAYDAGLIDQLIAVDGDEALRCARGLARSEGVLSGISAGATVAGAIQVLDQLPSGSHVLCLLADGAERYQTTALFEGIIDEMDDAEWTLSRATPGARFDSEAAASPAPAAPPPFRSESPDEWRAVGRLLGWINDPRQPVVIFGLTWCEYAHAMCRLFDGLEVPYRLVNLDAPEFDQDGSSMAMRAALHRTTGQPSVPQLFIGGHWVGGCEEAFEATRVGSMGQRLRALGLEPKEQSVALNRLLPRWAHARQPAADMDVAGAV